jgi:hypothetical protein
VELSLNTFEKTEEQKKRLSESIFNSTITENNTPINAIRRVVLKKKKKQKPSPTPGINGVINEDPEGEDEEYEEVEVDPEPIQQPRLEERNDAQVSSGEENQPADQGPGSQAQPRLERKESDDSFEDKKDQKKKDKKDKNKKDDKPKGYNEEELKRGTKLLANPNFRSNLDRLNRLRSQKNTANADQPADQPTPKTSSGALKLKPKVRLEVRADKKEEAVQEVMQESKVIQQEEYKFRPVEEPQVDRGSDIKLGEREPPHDFGESNSRPVATRVPKDALRASRQTPLITPNVNPDPPALQKTQDPILSNTASQKVAREKPTIKDARPRQSDLPEDFEVPLDDSKPSLGSKAQRSTKDSSNPQDDWEVSSTPQNKDPLPKKIMIPKKVPGQAPIKSSLKLSTGQMRPVSRAQQEDGSDNSWDGEKNPYK